MPNRGGPTRLLAVVGTLLVWVPVLVPVLLAAILFAAQHAFVFDHLIAAELFPAAVAGAALLILAALRARLRWALIGWGLAVAAGLWVGARALAAVAGLSGGESELARGWWAVAFAWIALFWLALLAIGIGALRLLRQLLATPR